ncbi:MAG: type II toxin-antitoxin system HicA family toxin [Planctomycetes bacterium]|nr:type II toxin-antitoxin system HicA family toxin [Planctomycetota bacterium]
MKREALLRHLRKNGCVLKREGARHSLWMNPRTGAVETIPRHNEIADRLAKRICNGLGVQRL